jgi:AbrB family looped-hinge helix DNA binding protein
MHDATITSKSQLTLPKAVREAMNLGPGDRVRFVPSLNGFRIVALKGDITRLRGIFHRPGRKPVSIEEMNKAIGRAVAKRHKRSPSGKRK